MHNFPHTVSHKLMNMPSHIYLFTKVLILVDITEMSLTHSMYENDILHIYCLCVITIMTQLFILTLK